MINLNKFSAVLLSFALTIYFFGSISFIKLHYLLGLVGLIFIATIAKNNYKTRRFYNPLSFLLLTFVIFLIIGNSYTSAPQYGLFKTFLFISILLPFILIKHFVFSFKPFLYSSSVLLLFLFMNKFGDPLSIFNNADLFFRLNSEENNPIMISRGLSLGLIISVFVYNKTDKIIVKSIKLTIILLLIIFIGLAGSKGPVISLLISILFYFIYKVKKGKISYKKLILLTTPIIISIIYFMSKFTFITDNRIFDTVSSQGSFDTRIGPQTFLINDFMDNNIFNTIFGSGTGSFGYAYTGKDFSEYPHNIFLEILYENGVLGLLIFIGFLCVLFFNFFNGRIEESKIYLFIISIFFLVNAQFSGDISANVLFFVFAYLSTSNFKYKTHNYNLN